MIDAHIPSAFLVGIRMEFFLPVRKSDLLNLFCKKKNKKFLAQPWGRKTNPDSGWTSAPRIVRASAFTAVLQHVQRIWEMAVLACLHADQDRAP